MCPHRVVSDSEHTFYKKMSILYKIRDIISPALQESNWSGVPASEPCLEQFLSKGWHKKKNYI